MDEAANIDLRRVSPPFPWLICVIILLWAGGLIAFYLIQSDLSVTQFIFPLSCVLFVGGGWIAIVQVANRIPIWLLVAQASTVMRSAEAAECHVSISLNRSARYHSSANMDIDSPQLRDRSLVVFAASGSLRKILHESKVVSFQATVWALPKSERILIVASDTSYIAIAGDRHRIGLGNMDFPEQR